MSEERKLVSDEYRKQLEEMHQRVDSRGSTWGASACRKIYDLLPWILRDGEPATLLDYGSADGKFQYQARRRGLLPNTEIIEYDPGIPEKANNNIPCEMVICIDVLEHIEPDLLDAVLLDLARCTEQTAILDIATTKARQILPDGRNAHLIIERPKWWRYKLENYFDILDHNICGPYDAPYLRAYVQRKKDED